MAKKSSPIEPKSLADFNKTMEDFAKELKGDMEMVTRDQIRLMCRDAMTFTPPMPMGGGRGLSVAAHKAGKNKLGNDVKRIFIPMDQPRRALPVVLRQVINSVRGGDIEGFRKVYDNANLTKLSGLSPVMRKILQDTAYTRAYEKAKNYLSKANIFGQLRPVAGLTNDLRGIHDRYKAKVNGRWPKGAGIGGPQYMVDSVSSLEAYITNRQLRVGMVKSGWAALLKMVPMSVSKKGSTRNFGSYNAPWVDANIRSSQGIFSATRRPGNVMMTVMNMIGNINNVSDKAGMENIVYGNRVKQMQTAINEYFNPTIQKANRRKK